MRFPPKGPQPSGLLARPIPRGVGHYVVSGTSLPLHAHRRRLSFRMSFDAHVVPTWNRDNPRETRACDGQHDLLGRTDSTRLHAFRLPATRLLVRSGTLRSGSGIPAQPALRYRPPSPVGSDLRRHQFPIGVAGSCGTARLRAFLAPPRFPDPVGSEAIGMSYSRASCCRLRPAALPGPRVPPLGRIGLACVLGARSRRSFTRTEP